MSKPRFFIVPARIADTIIARKLRMSWVDNKQEEQVLLSSSDLLSYGIAKALANGVIEIDSQQVNEIVQSIKQKNI